LALKVLTAPWAKDGSLASDGALLRTPEALAFTAG
jgi:hypothetical protein